MNRNATGRALRGPRRSRTNGPRPVGARLRTLALTGALGFGGFAALGAVSACSTSGGSHAAGPGSSSSVSTTPASTGAPGSGSTTTQRAAPTTSSTSATTIVRRRLLLGERDEGRTFAVALGTRIDVTLASTAWRLAPASPAGVVVQVGPQDVRVRRGPGCPVGSGCGSVTVHLRAVRAGTTVLEGDRSSCGEALRCPPNRQVWRVTLVVGS